MLPLACRRLVLSPLRQSHWIAAQGWIFNDKGGAYLKNDFAVLCVL